MKRPALQEGLPGPAPAGDPPREPGEERPRSVHWVLFSSLALGITALDLWTKQFFFKVLHVKLAPALVDGVPRMAVERHEPIVVIPGFFEIEANINYGAFSGWFAQHPFLLVVLSMAALLVIVLFLRSHLHGPGPHRLWFAAALGLLWGGTCGNLYDRAVFGYVRDFIKWFFVYGGKEHVWPNFNIADSSICVGVTLILLSFLLAPRAKGAEPAAEARRPGDPQVSPGARSLRRDAPPPRGPA